MTVFVQFQVKTGHQVVFFLNLPPDLEGQIQKSLSSARKDNPFVWHTILTQQAKALYNDAVWSIRDLVRSVEKVRNILWLLLPEILNLFNIDKKCRPAQFSEFAWYSKTCFSRKWNFGNRWTYSAPHDPGASSLEQRMCHQAWKKSSFLDPKWTGPSLFCEGNPLSKDPVSIIEWAHAKWDQPGKEVQYHLDRVLIL